MQEAVNGNTCDSNRLTTVKVSFPVNGCSTLKSLFHFTILGENKRKIHFHVHFPKTDQAPWSVISMWACRFAMPRHVQTRVPCPREELEMGFNEKRKQTTLIRPSPYQVSVLIMPVCTLTVPFTPLFFWLYCMPFWLSSMLVFPPSDQVPPGSSAEHPIINLLQAQNILPNTKSHALLATAPQPLWGCRGNGSQDCWWGSLLSCSHLKTQSEKVTMDPHLIFPCALCVCGATETKPGFFRKKSISLKTQVNNGLIACEGL